MLKAFKSSSATTGSSGHKKPEISVNTNIHRNKSTKSVTSTKSNNSLNSNLTSSSVLSTSSNSLEHNIKHSAIYSPIVESPLIPNYGHYRFLLVDDNLINLKILSKILTKLFPNCLLIKLSNSSTVMKLVEKEKFDLIFLDIEMPPISGVDISKKIRSNKKHNKVGLIAVTTRYTEKDLKVYKKIGIDFTFRKPLNYNMNLILNNIEVILNYRKNK